ncbi:MAG TPA: hypothetical protein VI382_10085 [Candidatus Manganitrophaceae bacterium]|nr:hypothetical protein [Candidatus Manganitrophaceae bacterium]
MERVRERRLFEHTDQAVLAAEERMAKEACVLLPLCKRKLRSPRKQGGFGRRFRSLN